MSLDACVSTPARDADAGRTPDAAAGPGTTGDGARIVAPPPRGSWQPGREASERAARRNGSGPTRGNGSSFTPFSQDWEGLSAEVALICSASRSTKPRDNLAGLVRDLYLSGVDPGMATEAMIRADCATVAAIVREMVTQGGEEAVDAVAERALALTGPRGRRAIELAASDGLDRNLGVGAQAPSIVPATPSPDSSQGYGMAYFPSNAESARVEVARQRDLLYTKGAPGYGVYTFVVLGGGFHPTSRAAQVRYAELLRVIETYVLAADTGAHVPSFESHAFLIPVQPDLTELPLAQRTWPELSAPLRKALVRALRKQGELALAQRLETGPGPFLVSTLEPQLIPTARTSPLLIADLSSVGAESMFGVVDAYDRPVPLDQVGHAESLTQIRGRLVGLVTPRPAGQEPDALGQDSWVFQLGAPATGGGQDRAASGALPAVDVARPGAGSGEGGEMPPATKAAPALESDARGVAPSRAGPVSGEEPSAQSQIR